MDAIRKFEQNVDAYISQLFDKEFTYPIELFIELLQVEDRSGGAGFPLLKDYIKCKLRVVEIKARSGVGVWFRCEILEGKYRQKPFFVGNSFEVLPPPKYITLNETTLWKYADVLKAKKFLVKSLGVNFSWATANFDIDVLNNVSMINNEPTKWKYAL